LSPTTDAGLLARYGFRTPERTNGELPQSWRDDPSWTALLQLAGGVADPDAAIVRLRRISDDTLDAARSAGERALPLLRCVGFSEYLTDLLARTPGLAAELMGSPRRERADLREARDAGFVHIAAADLVSEPTRESFVATTRALSDLADDCVLRALAAEDALGSLAVLGMGKYGAQELNYASDIDVLFVAAGESEPADRAARRLLSVMNGPPTLFRVDVDLRPEGRDGALVRSLDAYRAYYERWAKVWEFQSLIKCRFAVGDASTGRAFLDLIEPFVWPDTLRPEAIEQIRSLKARAEAEVSKRGLGERQVKLGRGGIRDAEFAVQLLQLVHGRHRPELRVRATLDGLDALADEGFVAPGDASDLVDAYVFLRHVEHRLQLVSGRQTHTLPDGAAKREHLARGLGFTDGAARGALGAFEDRWSRTTSVVRTIHERLFYRPLMETYASVPSVRPMSDEETEDRLAALGFDRPPAVRKAIAQVTSGGTRRAKVLRAVMPGALAWMAETPEPDAGMLRLADVARDLDGMPHLLAMLRDEPPVVELMCRLLGTGQLVAAMIERDPTLISALGPEGPPADLRAHALSIVRRADSPDEAAAALRRFKNTEFVRLAARDLTAGEDPDVFFDLAATLTDVADSCIEAAVDLARSEAAKRHGGIPGGAFSVIAMGRFGGRELSYASDLDVMFVYERDSQCPDGSDARLFHSDVAERVMKLLRQTPPIFDVDAELRPEGKSGPIVRSLQSYLVYYDRWASLWEFQALTRARHCAGDHALVARLLGSVSRKVWRPTMTDEDIAEIRRMKARIERERVKAREDPRYQVKLGIGGLADVEFTVQLLQMRHGWQLPQVRTPNTFKAIDRLEEAKVVESPDADWLRDAYLMLNRVRNHMFLLRGIATDALPTRDEDVERLARSLGFGRGSRGMFLERYRRITRRARQVCDRLFYGESDAS
jgi:[glutamine synthetase] adenylyltransferase / [glutamine synthetase]-adenylyl-L-tyrosine phosphorylase